MFNGASKFNIDISKWNVSSVIDMSYMFNGASSFNVDISKWNVSKVNNMSHMFSDASLFNQDISTKEISAEISQTDKKYKAWDVSSITNMTSMFNNALLFNQNLFNWSVIKIEEKPKKFDNNVKNWILPKPIWGSAPFKVETRKELDDAVNNYINNNPVNDNFRPIGYWDISSIKDMSELFTYESFNGD